MSRVFISYRREDAAGHAGRLCDRLSARLGSDRVFMDVEDIQPGQDFVRTIADTVAASDCLLVVIGPRWLELLKARSSAEYDLVRQEILSGLRRGLRVVPVLVAGARMPSARELPPDLADLSRRQAVEIRDHAFDDDVSRLAQAIASGPSVPERHAAPAFRRRWLAAPAVVVAAAVLGASYFLWRDAPIEIEGTWIAEMRKPGQPSYRVRLTFVRAGDRLAGNVRYPTGSGAIVDGAIDGRTLTFSTSHIPQFADAPAVIRYVATLEADRMRLVATDELGTATGEARRDASGESAP